MSRRTSTRRHRSATASDALQVVGPEPSRDSPPMVGPVGRRSARRSRILGVGLAVALVAGLGACSDDSPDTSSDATVETEIGDAAAIESSTTATETSVGDTTPAPPVGAPDPEAAAATLYGAWKAGDRATAATVAEPPAVEAIFAAAPGDYALYNRCNTGEFGAAACLYRGDPGTIQFSMTQREAAWVVTMSVFSPA